MKLLLAMIRYEVLLQLRSVRFRVAAVCYAVICALPSGLMYFSVRHQSTEVLGSAAYLSQLLQVQPYLTLLMVVLIAGNRSDVRALEESWAVLAASPVSNAGFILRRALALLALILPLTLVPPAVAALVARAAGNTSFDVATWIGTWALWILPMAVFLTCYWLAWVTVTGGELAALIVTFIGLPLAVSAANQILFRFHLTLSGYLDWFSYRSLFYWIHFTLQGPGALRRNFHPGHAATEAPFDPPAAAAWLLPLGALIAGFAALGLGLAVAFARRTRRDLRPRPVPPEHQLRTFLEKLNRWRERYAPDGGLGLPERLALAAGVVALGLAVAGLLGRQLTFQRLAAERYRAETTQVFAPLPAEVRPTTWKLGGRIDGDGAVEVQAAGRFENRGSEPVETLAFSLNRELEIERLEAPRYRVEVTRAWDRLQLRLDPALAAGDALDLELSLSGVPAAVDFVFGRWRRPFPVSYERVMHARFPREVSNLASSWVRRAASPRRVLLRAMDLGPVPRYTPWTLTRPGESRGEGHEPSDYGREVPIEAARIVVELELDFETPGGWFLADTCGHVSRGQSGPSRLAGSCRTSLSELMIAGGRLVTVDSARQGVAGEVTVAALPAHVRLAEQKLRSLGRVASLSDRAWPGMPGLEGVVAVEWPPEFHVDLSREMTRWSYYEPHLPELFGRLMLVPEMSLVDGEPFAVEDLVAQLLSRDLLERRQPVPDQELLFQHLFRVLMVRRMGLDGDRGATVSGKPWVRQALAVPILMAKSHHFVWRLRLPAVLAEIEGRVGGDNLYTAIESFLASGGEGEEPATVEGLLAEIEAVSGVSLERTYRDHFQGSALPMLRLEQVASRRQGDGWVVDGRVRNTGTGQSICPVIVKTEIGERTLTVTVDSESASPFAVRVEHRPHTVLLDPEKSCYRFLLKTSPTLERANLLG